MPRISAPTLVEHRERQREALLDAARELALDTAGQGITVAAVAERAGLARSSVYEYYPSTDSLMAHLVTVDLSHLAEDVAARMSRAADAEQRVAAFIRAWIAYRTGRAQQVVSAVLAGAVPPECTAAVAHLETSATAPLVAALNELGVRDPERSAAFVRGVADQAADRIAGGGSLRSETAAAERFVYAGLKG